MFLNNGVVNKDIPEVFLDTNEGNMELKSKLHEKYEQMFKQMLVEEE